MPVSPNQRGAIFMTLAMFGFTFNDTLVKYLTAEMSIGQIMVIRGLIASVLIFLLARHRGALRPLKTVFNRWIGLRLFGEIGGTLTFLTGLSQIPIANATAILQALPLAVTMGAAVFLKEPVGWRRWSAILVGFVGVILIVRPGAEGFSPYSLLIVGTVLFAATRDIATRKIDHRVPTLFISTITSPLVALSGFLLTPPFSQSWTSVNLTQLGILAVAASFLLIAYHFMILTMREGDISFIAPFRYTGFLFAVLLGYLMFGDVPDIYIISGGLIIICTGLYTLYRESRRKDAREVAAEAPARHMP